MCFGWLKRKQQVKKLNQMFNSTMADIRIYEQRGDYRGAIIAAFHSLSSIANVVLRKSRAPYQTAREFGIEAIAKEANISEEVMNDFLTYFEIARYTEDDVDYEYYQESIQRLDICFRGLKEQGVQLIDAGKETGTTKKLKTRKEIKTRN